METKNIYQRMAAIMLAVKAVEKTERNQQQGFMFRGIDNVMNELHDIFADNGVFILPNVLNFTTENRMTQRGGAMTFTRATIRFTFIAEDGSSVEAVTVGEAMDSGDKGMNKAMSIALKYALMQTLLIPTKEDKDPDRETPPDTDYVGMALQEIKGASDIDVLKDIFRNYSFLKDNAEFMAAMTARKNELKNAR